MGVLKVRSGQVISPFGIGSLVEIDGQSFSVRGVHHWGPDSCFERVKIEALEKRLPPNKQLRRPTKYVPAVRFPQWLFCTAQNCGRLLKYGYYQEVRSSVDGAPERPRCPDCGHWLAPMRFVQACEKGHLDDIDWYWVAHKDQERAKTGSCSKSAAILRFKSDAALGGDFSSMMVSCACGARGNLSRIAEGSTSTCYGRQPGEHSDKAGQNCGEPMFMLPRGAGALHYAHVASALDIASSANTSRSDALRADRGFEMLVRMVRSNASNNRSNAHINEGYVDVLFLAEEFSLTPQEVLAVLWEMVNGSGEASPRTGGDLNQLEILSEEFEKLVDPAGVKGQNFYTTPIAPSPALHPYFKKVVQVSRLREVRAFYGFSRRKGNPANIVPPDLGANQRAWLPATEVVGEGIFLEFSRDAVKTWLEDDLEVIERATMQQVRSAEEDALPSRLGFNASAPFIMAHTFAHALARQLAFTCGYSSSSLRERVYCKPVDDIGLGVLVYTADADSEGSMGGLVEMGNPVRLEPVVRQALENMRWCSNDPVCRERDEDASYSRAACHACSFIAETSCAYQNMMLNRLLVIGTGETNQEGVREPRGFFSGMLGG